jgi:glycosyltransferase involved in cell wall biosynthesis
VIIPAYDSAAVIERTLGSVAAQTYRDFEVIVADDASTDDTAERARATGLATVVSTGRNTGPAGARNRALQEAGGELVAFLDADDEWLPTYLERQVARYDAEVSRPGPPVGIVACDARLPGAAETYLEVCEREHRLPLEPLDLERILRRNCIYVSALVPRDAVQEIGGFDPDLFGTEDHDLWIRILETGRRAVLNREVLCVYHQPEGSISSNLARMAANNQKTYERALRRGRLNARQQRLARRELRYNRAMEAVAAAILDRRPAALPRALPGAVVVAVTNLPRWRGWARALRS